MIPLSMAAAIRCRAASPCRPTLTKVVNSSLKCGSPSSSSATQRSEVAHSSVSRSPVRRATSRISAVSAARAAAVPNPQVVSWRAQRLNVSASSSCPRRAIVSVAVIRSATSAPTDAVASGSPISFRYASRTSSAASIE